MTTDKELAVLVIFDDDGDPEHVIVFENPHGGAQFAMPMLRGAGIYQFMITTRVDFVSDGEEQAYCEMLTSQLIEGDDVSQKVVSGE